MAQPTNPGRATAAGAWMGGILTGDIVGEVVEIFDGMPDRAEDEVVTFLDDLAARGLVDWCTSNSHRLRRP